MFVRKIPPNMHLTVSFHNNFLQMPSKRMLSGYEANIFTAPQLGAQDQAVPRMILVPIIVFVVFAAYHSFGVYRQEVEETDRLASTSSRCSSATR